MTFQFNPLFPEASNEAKWEQIKLWRDAELRRSDWTMHTDAPTNKDAWAIYRQALRDLPTQGGLADNAQFPTQPGAN
jgi:hypothetical protein